MVESEVVDRLAEKYTEAHFRQRNPLVEPTPEKLWADRILYIVTALLNENGRDAWPVNKGQGHATEP